MLQLIYIISMVPIHKTLVTGLSDISNSERQVCVQNELGVIDRVQSVSDYSVEACGQELLSCGKVAVSDTDLSNATLLAYDVNPYVDGVVASYAYADDARIFAFSASMDPGALCIWTSRLLSNTC